MKGGRKEGRKNGGREEGRKNEGREGERGGEGRKRKKGRKERKVKRKFHSALKCKVILRTEKILRLTLYKRYIV